MNKKKSIYFLISKIIAGNGFFANGFKLMEFDYVF